MTRNPNFLIVITIKTFAFRWEPCRSLYNCLNCVLMTLIDSAADWQTWEWLAEPDKHCRTQLKNIKMELSKEGPSIVGLCTFRY